MNPLRSRRDYGEENEMNEDKISSRVAASMMTATTEHYDSIEDMPRGVRKMVEKFLSHDAAIEETMSPDGITWVADTEGASVMIFRGKLLGTFEYGGSGLKRMKGLKESVLLDFLNTTIN